jgi:hypothetical protein
MWLSAASCGACVHGVLVMITPPVASSLKRERTHPEDTNALAGATAACIHA